MPHGHCETIVFQLQPAHSYLGKLCPSCQRFGSQVARKYGVYWLLLETTMLHNVRKGAWHLDPPGIFPRCIVGPGNTSPSVTSHLLREFNAELTSDVLQRQILQLCRGDVELKCKLSDLKVALTKTHIQSPVMEFTQSGPNSHNYSIDSDNSNQWFEAQCQ